MRGKSLVLLFVALLALSQAPINRASEAVDDAPAVGSAGAPVRTGAEEYTFQAEVNRLMDILIHSLYSNKDIFLRELISNAADALDKIRFMSLTDKGLLGEGDNQNLEIKISLDKENRFLYIRDRGIGMTHDELVKNLGTIAKSGTSAFLEQMQKGGDINLIGQFGVGFYSVYLVADWVEVISKHNDDKQYIWTSTADGSFTIAEDKENEPLGRGTMIKIHLKEEALEYAQESKLKELVQRYSEFMNFPIYLQLEREVDVPIEDEEPEDEAAAADDEDDVSDDDDEDDEDDDDEADTEADKAPKTRKEKQLVWDLINDNKAIWLRPAADVTDEEYAKFYKAVAKAYDEPLSWSHFKAEGDVEFKSIMYIPTMAPYDFYEKYYERGSANSMKLYVRRVFISDDMTDMVPRYLSFIRGIVDSDTLPLQVSREVLQQHAALKTIKKKLVRKALDMIKKMADDEAACNADGGADDDGGEGADKPSAEDCAKFGKFYTAFGRSIKLGIIEDSNNRNRLSKLLRFHTTKSPDKLISLDDYVGRMKDGQKEIYFISGKNMDEMKNSPFLEKLIKKDYEVVYFTDVLDEYVAQHMIEYDDKKLSDATKDGLKLTDKDEKEKKRDKELREEFKELTRWWKDVIGDKQVSSVKVSNRLHSTPCVVVAGKYSQSANMERIQRAQAFRDDSRAMFSNQQRVLEINPRHPLVRALKEQVDADPASDQASRTASLLWETALLESGFDITDSKAFSSKVYELLRDQMGIKEALEVDEEPEEEEEEEEEPAAEEDEMLKEEL